MTPSTTTLHANDSIAAALSVLASHHVHHVAIVDERGAPIGVVGEQDLRFTLGLNPCRREDDGARLDWRVWRAMGEDAVTVGADDDLTDAMETMAEHHLAAAAVVGARGELVGIVSYVDALRRIDGAATH